MPDAFQWLPAYPCISIQPKYQNSVYSCWCNRKFGGSDFFSMVNGDLMMTKPDFSKMTRQELRAYILTHREDDRAIEAFINRSNPDSPTYPFPQTDEDFKAMEEVLKRKLGMQ
jgi:hypothetical protein